MRRATVLAGTLLVACPSLCRAHGRRADPDTWWQAWNWDPLVLLTCGLLAWLYGRGLGRLRTRARHKVRVWQAASYFAGLLTVAAALVSPLDALSEELSSLHMVQHMLLMTVAAPLVALGSPAFVLAWGLSGMRLERGRAPLPRAFRILAADLLWQPLFLWVLFAATLWVWHHPTLYHAALRYPLAHDAQHISFFVAGCLFWRVCFDPLGRRRLNPGMAVPYLFTTSLHASLMGVFLALSPLVWYGDYATRTWLWGFTPLEDQQLAGLIMWMPACLVYPAAAAILFGIWLAGLDGTTQRRTCRRAYRAAQPMVREERQPWTPR
jgi:cytochrome c oxidase assembly factor CtaG